MKIAILGTGSVGQALSGKLTALGHQTMLGGRKNFAEAAAFGELAFLCTKGEGAVAAVNAAREHLAGKVLIDITNPLDFSKGMPPTLFVSNTDSLGEQVQRAVPACRVVKTLNTVTAALMVDPGKLAGGEHDMFMCGNDAAAKKTVEDTVLRGMFGWKHVIDLGDITNARGTEAYLALWVRLYGAMKTSLFNAHFAKTA